MSKEAKVESLNGANNNKLKEDVEMVFGTPESPKNDVKPAVHHVNERRQGNGSPNSRNRGETEEPLLTKPPLAEIESLESDDKPKDAATFPDGDDVDRHRNNLGKSEDGDADLPPDDAKALDIAGEDGNWHGHDETDFYYGDGYVANGIHTRAGEDRPGSPVFSINPQIIPDVNTYQQKKNLAQGMMDLALLSANANQLRYVLESRTTHPYYYPSLVFIGCSILLQVAVGVGLILNSRYNVKDDSDICKADKINNMTVLGIFLITIVNVFITSFSVADRNVIATGT